VNRIVRTALAGAIYAQAATMQGARAEQVRIKGAAGGSETAWKCGAREKNSGGGVLLCNQPATGCYSAASISGVVVSGSRQKTPAVSMPVCYARMRERRAICREKSVKITAYMFVQEDMAAC